MAHVQIFLSTVSAEFRSYRDALRRDLDRAQYCHYPAGKPVQIIPTTAMIPTSSGAVRRVGADEDESAGVARGTRIRT